jgi:hypothetical protein
VSKTAHADRTCIAPLPLVLHVELLPRSPLAVGRADSRRPPTIGLPSASPCKSPDTFPKACAHNSRGVPSATSIRATSASLQSLLIISASKIRVVLNCDSRSHRVPASIAKCPQLQLFRAIAA